MSIYPKILLLHLAAASFNGGCRTRSFGAAFTFKAVLQPSVCCKKCRIHHASTSSYRWESSWSNTITMMSKNEEEQENDGTLSNVIQQSTSTAGAWNSPQSLVESLLEKTTSRAFRTLTTTDSSVFNDNGGGDKTVNDVIEAMESNNCDFPNGFCIIICMCKPMCSIKTCC